MDYLQCSCEIILTSFGFHVYMVLKLSCIPKAHARKHFALHGVQISMRIVEGPKMKRDLNETAAQSSTLKLRIHFVCPQCNLPFKNIHERITRF